MQTRTTYTKRAQTRTHIQKEHIRAHIHKKSTYAHDMDTQHTLCSRTYILYNRTYILCNRTYIFCNRTYILCNRTYSLQHWIDTSRNFFRQPWKTSLLSLDSRNEKWPRRIAKSNWLPRHEAILLGYGVCIKAFGAVLGSGFRLGLLSFGLVVACCFAALLIARFGNGWVGFVWLF